MSYSKIRPSLHYYTYKEHAISLKLAADDILEKAVEVNRQWGPDQDRIKSLGLFRSAFISYAVSIELILKARALFEERDNILEGRISNFKQFIKKWKPSKSNGHDYFEIIGFYKIELTEQETILLENFQPYTSWAGRYPYPKNEELIEKFEKDGRESGVIGLRHQKEVQDFLDRQCSVIEN